MVATATGNVRVQPRGQVAPRHRAAGVVADLCTTGRVAPSMIFEPFEFLIERQSNPVPIRTMQWTVARVVLLALVGAQAVSRRPPVVAVRSTSQRVRGAGGNATTSSCRNSTEASVLRGKPCVGHFTRRANKCVTDLRTPTLATARTSDNTSQRERATRHNTTHPLTSSPLPRPAVAVAPHHGRPLRVRSQRGWARRMLGR